MERLDRKIDADSPRIVCMVVHIGTVGDRPGASVQQVLSGRRKIATDTLHAQLGECVGQWPLVDECRRVVIFSRFRQLPSELVVEIADDRLFLANRLRHHTPDGKIDCLVRRQQKDALLDWISIGSILRLQHRSRPVGQGLLRYGTTQDVHVYIAHRSHRRAGHPNFPISPTASASIGWGRTTPISHMSPCIGHPRDCERSSNSSGPYDIRLWLLNRGATSGSDHAIVAASRRRATILGQIRHRYSSRGVVYLCPARFGQHTMGQAAVPNLPVTALSASIDRKSTRLNSSHGYISYAVFCLKKKKKKTNDKAKIEKKDNS